MKNILNSKRITDNFMEKGSLVQLVILCVTLLSIWPTGCDSLHVKGTWETDEFFLFLAKFGFQKTEINNKYDTQGYVFGNITSPTELSVIPRRISKRDVSNTTSKDAKLPETVLKAIQSGTFNSKNTTLASTIKPLLTSSSITSDIVKLLAATPIISSTTTSRTTTISPKPTSKSTTTTTKKTTTTTLPPLKKIYPATLVVLDRGYFLEYYRNRNIEDKDEACKAMFEQISHVAYDSQCYPSGTENFLRRIPCEKGELCVDDSSHSQFVVKDHQFTYALSDSLPKFWYASLVACYRDPLTCEWKHTGNHTVIDYDIWLVNGNPYTKNQNPLEYQFSYDRQDTVEIYIIFFMCYLVLFPLQVHAVLRQRHIVPRLFTISVSLELVAVFANVIHVLRFALNGEGWIWMAALGDIMDILSRALFMLILLVLAKGWAITRTDLTGKPFIFTIWLLYMVVHLCLYVWKETEVDVIEDIDEYQTWPGWLILVLRNIIMIWFIYELKTSMSYEHNPKKLAFFLHFGAASLVWFIYLPIIAIVALRLQVSPLWTYSYFLGITQAADCLGFFFMAHLLWPTRSKQYFLLTSKMDTSIRDELEEFNEAPHVVNAYSRRPANNRYPINYSFRDVVSSQNGVSLHHNNGFSGSSTYGDDCKDNVPLIIS